jgi:putative Holliday junction resolvase
MPSSPSCRIAGVDFGTVRIGVAIADPEVGFAVPLENYVRSTLDLDARHFRRLVDEERIGRFVVGLPVHLHGGESQMSVEARRFGQWLGDATGVPVEYFDERFTSSEADQILIEAKLSKKKRKARLDMLAAQRMLAAYLESGGTNQDAPRGIDD